MAHDTDNRRQRLLLNLLRLSRDAGKLASLEAALAILDDGGLPWAPPESERTLLRHVAEGLADTFEADAYLAWHQSQEEAIERSVAAMNRARQGHYPPPDADPVTRGLIAAAGEFQAKTEGGEAPAEGNLSSGGWRLVAGMELEQAMPFSPSRLWALSAPDGALFIAATGAAAPEPWTLTEVRQLADERKQAAELAGRFAGAAELACPQERARRASSIREFLRERADAERLRKSLFLIGETRFLCMDGIPVSATGMMLPSGATTEARRLDHSQATPDMTATVSGEQVWQRPLGNRVWRRGRIRIAGDTATFIDDAGAQEPAHAAAMKQPRTLEADIQESAAIRSKARSSNIYASLLASALENASWLHRDGTSWQGGSRSTGDFIAHLTGRGDYITWIWNGVPAGLDEEVVADLGRLGWDPSGGSA